MSWRVYLGVCYGIYVRVVSLQNIMIELRSNDECLWLWTDRYPAVSNPSVVKLLRTRLYILAFMAWRMLPHVTEDGSAEHQD
jgi:hypothetical protein